MAEGDEVDVRIPAFVLGGSVGEALAVIEQEIQLLIFELLRADFKRPTGWSDSQVAIDTVGIPTACTRHHCPRRGQITLCLIDLDRETGRITAAIIVGC